MSNEVSFLIKIKDDGGAKRVTADAKEMGKAIREVQDEAEKASRDILTWSEAAQAIDIFEGSIGELKSALTELTAEYKESVAAQTKLEVIMRQRMGATNAEIGSVRELCSKLQEEGVVEDDIAASGAQQLATFLKRKESLDTLIPAMEDLIAQQEGYNATGEGAVSIGNMMGKAMQGQTEVLQRVGITFDEAQKKILQYGTESQRAAMLAQVITQNVGHMNLALGQTDIGRQKQLLNHLGDIREQIGRVVEKIEPAITIIAQLSIAAAGVVKLMYILRTLNASIISSLVRIAASSNLVRSASLSLTAVLRVTKGALTGASVGATTLRVAIKGLLISTGVGIAIVALTEIVGVLAEQMGKAGDKADEMAEAEARAKADAEALKSAKEAERQTMEQTRSELEINIQRLKQFHGTREQEKTLVEEMNNTYGQTLGYFSSVSEWYHALTSDSEAYCRQMVAEARIRGLANQIAKKQQEIHDLTYDETGKKRRYAKNNGTFHTVETGRKKKVGVIDESGQEIYVPEYKNVSNHDSDLEKAETSIRKARAEINASQKEMEAVYKDATSIIIPVKGATAAPTGAGTSRKASYRASVGGKNGADTEAVPQLVLRPMELYKGEADGIKGSISSVGDMMQAQVDRINGMRAKATWIEQLKDAGVLSAEAASQAIGEINDQLDALGAKKVDIDIDSNSAEKARKRLENATDAIGQMGSSLSSMGDAMEMPILNVAGTLAQAIATMALGYAQATSKSAALGPWGWIAFAATGLAQLAAMVSAVKGMSKFADGGIAYGPTIGLFGEYAGASHNPEVVAPLDKLRGMLKGSTGEAWNGGEVEFRIRGRNLEGVLKKRERRMSRL